MALVSRNYVLVNFKIDCCNDDKCRVCMLPAIPHVRLNCGHALCGMCAERSSTCPSCRAAVWRLTPDSHATARIRKAVRYECSDPEHSRRGCAFVGNFEDAKRHAAKGAHILEGFKIECDERNKCRVCKFPAVPYIELTCGHPVCERCAKRVDTCPSCDTRVWQRTPDRCLTKQITGSLRYRCASAAHARHGCTFVGNSEEAKRHAEDTRELTDFEVDCDESDLCPVCLLPAVPHVLLNCGHPLCKPCAERVHTCPSCRVAVRARTSYHQMSERIRSSLRYRCSHPAHKRAGGCTFVGNFDEAKRHVAAGETVLGFHDAFPQLTYAEIEAVVKGKQKHDEDGMMTGLIEARKRKQPASASSSACTSLAISIISVAIVVVLMPQLCALFDVDVGAANALREYATLSASRGR
jgi:hypothetical protein